MTVVAVRKSDLGVRTLSAIVMLAVAGAALWLGGWAWATFVVLVAMGVLWEWRGLVRGFNKYPLPQAAWNAVGFVYIALAAIELVSLRSAVDGRKGVLVLVGAVIATDIGAYAFGRAIGGPKLAPRISPSKTWAGLVGGIVGASLILFAILKVHNDSYVSTSIGNLSSVEKSIFPMFMSEMIVFALLMGTLIAVVAQTGDFFESWMKRRAGVKDSGRLIPGHGGLLDRVDGLLAVCFIFGVLWLCGFVVQQ